MHSSQVNSQTIRAKFQNIAEQYDQHAVLQNLIAAELVSRLELINIPVKQVLDLGCGYGYLTMSASSLGFKKLYTTDNNAAALLAIDENAKQNNIDIEYWPDDVGKNIDRSFDLVLSNPPFHQGFDHQKSITQEFIGQMARLTSPTGTALVVVNQFIGLQPLAAKVFSNVEIVAENKSFKVFSCRR